MNELHFPSKLREQKEPTCVKFVHLQTKKKEIKIFILSHHSFKLAIKTKATIISFSSCHYYSFNEPSDQYLKYANKYCLCKKKAIMKIFESIKNPNRLYYWCKKSGFVGQCNQIKKESRLYESNEKVKVGMYCLKTNIKRIGDFVHAMDKSLKVIRDMMKQ